MPALQYELLKKIQFEGGIEANYPIFVETGTCEGRTIFEMEKYFDELHTIEIKEGFYTKVKSRYKGDKIHFHLGDSSKVLPKIASDLKSNTLFFLDGHWSSGNTGRGEKDCPLIEELKVINSKFSHKAIIIIDDYRLFGKGPNIGGCAENWEDIQKSKVLDIVQNRLVKTYHLPSSYHKEDRMLIHLRSI